MMDSEIEEFLYENNTFEIDDFKYETTVWDYMVGSVVLSFTFLGVLANYMIIYMIARNVRMRSKTNIILMNFAINNALFLLCNLHLHSALLELLNVKNHLISGLTYCVRRYLDVGFQFNEALVLIFLMSNALMKSKRIQVKWLLIGIYTFTVCSFVLHLIFCYYDMFPVFDVISFLVMVSLYAMVLFKEINSCYKKWYKKDPLSSPTQFRLNIARIYTASWFIGFVLLLISRAGLQIHYSSYALSTHSLMTSMYILIYIVCVEKNFRICLLNMLRCKGAGDYDVDATITFAEEDSNHHSNEGSLDNNQVNINFNNTENH